MKINELVEMYEKNPRIDIAQKIEAVPYVGVEYKRMLADLVLDNCTSVVDGEIHVDSVEKYLLFTISVIGLHTNLDFSFEEDSDVSAIDEYDALSKSGLLVKIIDTFKDDYLACQEILNMMTADRLQNNMTIEKKIYQFLDSMTNMLEGGINDLTEKMNLSGFDTDSLMQLVNSFGNK